MAEPKPPTVTRLSALRPKERGTFFAVLAEKTKGITSNNKPYYLCRFRDARRSASFMVWADGGYFDACETEWAVGQPFKIHATYTDHEKYGPQIDVIKIRPVEERDAQEGYDPADLAEPQRGDAATTFATLRGLAETNIADEPLRRLTVGLLDRHADKLKLIPASERRFHTYPGGWLDHTLSVLRTALKLVDHYRELYPQARPPLNRDVVAAGAVLHDLGRAVEFGPGDTAVEPTVDGRLFGHVFLGRDLFRDAAREQGDVNPDLLRLVEHLFVAHLNHPEWGSPRLPLIPEVLILHHADDLDAKMEMFVRCLTNDPGDGPFTARDATLGRALYKGRPV
jgi:3'-5' exoribonuclease